jgi:hypothetical protein
VNPESFYIVSGTMPVGAQSYVERQADADLLTALLAGDYCFVLNSRQMGKSSLSAHTIARLRENGVRLWRTASFAETNFAPFKPSDAARGVRSRSRADSPR